MNENYKTDDTPGEDSVASNQYSGKSYIEVGRIDDEAVESLMVEGNEQGEISVAKFIKHTNWMFCVGCLLGVGFACAVLFVIIF